MTTAQVVILRDSSDAGKPGRVYVTGPHFGSPLAPNYDSGIYSSTRDRANASAFDTAIAERLLAVGKWRGLDPQLEALEEAVCRS